MGMIGRILAGPAVATLGQTVTTVADVFTPNATKRMQASHEAYLAALGEYGAEFQYVRPGPFDRFVNGLNRLPRPMLALGTLALFVYAMIDPDSFTRRMVGLNYVPEPLWWLLAAIVGFYFGAREAHYVRAKPVPPPAVSAAVASEGRDGNAALAEWRRGNGD
ncbi:holin family protein [Defluviimonas sp. SAOS-178_SWC]|uniref:holin family protein n=1 Tax=Defluviimonas sp. SAOS-178_SWC TaxID=3121287 RepID=UPI0032218AC2